MSASLSLWKVVYSDGSVCTEKNRFGFHNSAYGEGMRGRGAHIQTYTLSAWSRSPMLPIKYAWDGLEFL